MTSRKSLKVLITSLSEAEKFMIGCLVASGASPENARIVATNLITADSRGYYSHGMNRLHNYVKDLQLCQVDGAAIAEVVKETPATALVEGNNALGAVIGTRCMEIAVKKAKAVGVGLVAARGGNHYGLASFYPIQAMKEGLIGLSASNTSPLMCPIRAKEAALGTNPISVGAKACGEDDFVLDISTTAVSLGKIEYYKLKGEKLPIGWALNEQGQPETDPDVAYQSARLMPLGGGEENSGYKGYGLSFMVELLTGLLSGAAYGPNVRKWGQGSKPANLGSVYIAIDPQAFEPCFEERLQDLIDFLRKMEPVDKAKPVMVHGDVERTALAKVLKDGGLRYVKKQHEVIEMLGKELKVEIPCSKNKECDE